MGEPREDLNRNIFADAAKKKVPVKVIVDGKEVTVGEAELVDAGNGLVHVDMDLKTDDPDDVINLFGSGITGYSMTVEPEVETKHHEIGGNAPVQHRMTEAQVQEKHGLEPHRHEPKQHRDGKPPWCTICKLTADYQEPKSNYNAFNFGTPSLPLRRDA